MITEMKTLIAELQAGERPSNTALEEVVRKRARDDMLRETIDAAAARQIAAQPRREIPLND